MKKILYIAVCLAAVASMGSCKKKVASTASQAAKQYAEHLRSDNYDKFVEAIVFTEPVAPAVKKVVNKVHATQLRTIHHPSVTKKGGIKEVRVVSETPAPDKKSAKVVLTNHYNNGVVETVNYDMVKANNIWKIRETPYKEIWKATTNEGSVETIKLRTGHDRDFIKEKDNGEKQFVKDITHRNGQVEVIKTLENGIRHREVIKTIEDGNREVDKLKVGGNKIGVKDIDRVNSEVLKAKENVNGQRDHVRKVISK